MEREIRRCRDTLSITGTGILVIALYTISKSIYLIINMLNGNNLDIIINDYSGSNLELFITVFCFIYAVYALLDFALRCFVSLSARAESKGKKKGIGYLICAGILIALHILSAVSSIIYLDPETIFESIISIIIELTSIIIIVDLIRNSLTLKKLTAQKS